MEELSDTKTETKTELPCSEAELSNNGPVITFETSLEDIMPTSEVIPAHIYNNSLYFSPRPLQSWPDD